MINFTKEDIELIEKFVEIKNKGYYADGKQVTEVYNRVFDTRLTPTNCGSCIRGRIQQMENELNHFKAKIKAQEELNNDKVDNVSPDENKANTEEKKRIGRPKKK